MWNIMIFTAEIYEKKLSLTPKFYEKIKKQFLYIKLTKMTDVKVLSNRESLTKYIELFYKGFTDLENKYLFDLYDIDDDDDFRLSSFETG